ncbi:hypothetical protein [Leptospira tipperaryensis]|nr:hypothetical protein [Leptospira tipperaryensis]
MQILTRVFLLVSALILFIHCVKRPQKPGVIELFPLERNIEQLNTPVKVLVQVSGLNAGTLTVNNDIGESLTFTQNTTQAFPTLVRIGSSYSVTSIGPSTTPAQTCRIQNPNGPIIRPQTTIFITCGTSFYDVSVRVIGLDPATASASPLILQNMTDQISFTNDTTQTFGSQVGDTAAYSIGFISVPPKHTCVFVPALSGNGNLAGGPVTILIDCISPLQYSPTSKILFPSGKITIQFSFHGIDPGSCGYNTAAAILGKTNVANTTSPRPSITYPSAPNDDTVVIIPSGPDFWGPLGDAFIQLGGCTGGGGLPIQGGNDLVLEFTNQSAINNRMVDIGSGNDISGCGTGGPPSAYCSSIEFGVTECDLVGAPCSVLVAAGTYVPTRRISLSSQTSLLGGFPSGFGGLNSDPVNNPTIIQDPGIGGPAFCDASFCSVIDIATNSLTSASNNLIVSGFSIRANPNNVSSVGVTIQNSRFNAGQVRILNNIIFGNETSPAIAAGTKVGLAIQNSDNVIVSGNWIRAGSGTGFSSGVNIDLSGTPQPIILKQNLIDGVQSAGGFATGFIISGSSAIIVDNKINAHQYLNPSLVPSLTMGFLIDDASGVPGFLSIFNNHIYVGNSPAIAMADATGISLGFAAPGKVYTIANNQIFARSSVTNRVGILYADAYPSAASFIRGNNFFLDVPVLDVFGGGVEYKFCGAVLSQDCILSFPIGPISGLGAGNYTNNYDKNPQFKTATSIAQVWNFNVPTGLPTSLNSPCSSLYGGIDLRIAPLIPAFFFPLFATDFAQNTRTNAASPFAPLGSDSISIGVFESDGNCF